MSIVYYRKILLFIPNITWTSKSTIILKRWLCNFHTPQVLTTTTYCVNKYMNHIYKLHNDLT